jgi:hypothetical protein
MIVRIRFVSTPLAEATLQDDELVVVTDTTWTGPSDPRQVGLRELVEVVMERRDLNHETTEALDAWAEASGVVDAMTIEDVSFWYGLRLGYWLWILEAMIWLGVLDQLLDTHPAVGEVVGGDADETLALAIRLVRSRTAPSAGEVATAGSADLPDAIDPAASPAPAAKAEPPVPVERRPDSRIGRIRWRFRPPEYERRRRIVAARLAAIEADPIRRVLVVQAHLPQRVETPRGPAFINAYLGPVVDRLRGTRLEPFIVDLRARLTAAPNDWRRLEQPDAARTLPLDVADTMAGRHPGADRPRDVAHQRAGAIRASGAPLIVSGVDVGPALTARIADRVAGSLSHRIVEVRRLRGLLRKVHPAGILLADEYHRQDWLAAAGAEQVPVAAVQHGVISRWHVGYVHATRPDALRLPARTYVFGSWERELLLQHGGYRPDEVTVSGSPRLDLVQLAADPDGTSREALRRELGVADGDRLVVLSGSWGALQRRFHYPVVLAQLFAEPLDRVHVVIKLHPSEKDEGPYRATIERLAAAGGFAPPPITVVQAIDLYRLLAAADAHLGIYSTVLTEAAVTGTPNLLAAGISSADLLGYVDAGVAVPVRRAADILAALDRPREEVMRPADRDAFIRSHFEPGDATGRIADDLLAWMAG